MTRKSNTKAVDKLFAEGRLLVAPRAYLKAARQGALMAEEGDVGNPIMLQIVNAAIAYTDALTARYAAMINQRDHMSSVKALRDAVGHRLPTAQETRLRRILGEKDEVQYGARSKTRDEAAKMLFNQEEFAVWAESEFQRIA